MAESPLTQRQRDFAAWYQDVVLQGDMAEPAEIVKGCTVIKPNGYAVWEMIQRELDDRFKATNHQNCYFPLLIPESFLHKEAEHVEGFSPELAVVTIAGGKKLEEPYVIRPTSETTVGHFFSKWIQSYRDAARGLLRTPGCGPAGAGTRSDPAGIPRRGRPCYTLEFREIMRQIVLEQPRQFVGHVVPPVVSQPGEALVRLRRIAICGSDWHAFDGAQANYTYPRIIGHELSCDVLEAPENSRGIRPGDRCAIEPHLTCGVCRPCRLNRPNCCENMKVLGVHVDGGMRGLMNVPVERLYKSERLSYDQLALVEFFTIGAHAVARSGLIAGEDVLIVGAGPIGLSVLQFALSCGATARIIEKVEFRRQFAARFGVEVLPDYDGRPASIVFDCTGDEQAITASFDRVGPAGRLVLVGQFLGFIPFDHTPFIRRELTIMASRNSHHQFPRVIGMMERGELNVDPWITCRMPLAEVPAVFAELASHKNYIKAVFEVQDSDV